MSIRLDRKPGAVVARAQGGRLMSIRLDRKRGTGVARAAHTERA